MRKVWARASIGSFAVTAIIAGCTEEAPLPSASVRTTERPEASCPVEVETLAEIASGHVPEGTPLTPASRPPANGPHYTAWAQFDEHGDAFEDGYLIHSLEHGAVALLYRCNLADPGCDATVQALRQLRANAPADPLCDKQTRTRILIAPYPSMDVPVAAVTWGVRYKAECIDLPTLGKFITDHYDKSPEHLCNPGILF